MFKNLRKDSPKAKIPWCRGSPLKRLCAPSGGQQTAFGFFGPAGVLHKPYLRSVSCPHPQKFRLPWYLGGSVKHPTLGFNSGLDLRVVGSSPAVGFSLGVEPT